MGRKQEISIGGTDSLELLETEIEELENDELSLEEAGFLFGYESERDADEWVKEELQLRMVEERLGEIA